MRKIIITEIRGKKLCFVYFMDELVDIFMADETQIGHIFVGRVNHLLEDLDGCFVNIGQDQPCFLRGVSGAKDIQGNPLKKDALVTVQMSKEAKDRKAPVLSADLEINGKYCVVTYGKYGVGISKKIHDKEERKRLREIAADNRRNGYGIIFRTDAIRAKNTELSADLQAVYAVFDRIFRKAQVTSKPCCLYQSEADYRQQFRENDEIITDLPDEYESLRAVGCALKLYDDDYPLIKLYGLEGETDRLLQQRVYMKNGANLVIQPTEAMTVIDINSAHAINGRGQKTGLLDMNLAAAREVMRQLRLRNLSGIIMIDFINMDSEWERRQVQEAMEEMAIYDYAKVNLYGFTRLGIMEISRMRVHPSLREYLNA